MMEKFWTVIINAVLFALGTFALLWLATIAGCTHAQAKSEPEEPLRVLILASVPGEAWFCIEDPQANGFFEEPNVRHGLISCPLTVAQLRRAIARLQVAD